MYFIYNTLKKLYTGLTFFNKSYIVENFRSIRELERPYLTASHGPVAEFVEGPQNPLPLEFTLKNEIRNIEEWLKSQWTTGLVVLKIEDVTKAKLLHESYYLGNTKESKTISWSINKSVVSALIGIAISEGKINSVEDYVTVYVPSLKDSGYDNVKLIDVLQMSSGVHFDENYGSIFSDINMMCFWLILGYDLESYIKTLKKETLPGLNHNYISSDTQVLGMVLKNATGQSLTSYLEEKLWSKVGFEYDCDWLVDNSGMELAFGTLNTCTRDYARFGWLYMNSGLSPLDGSRLIDEQWITDSVSCTKQHLKPSYPKKFGYGYQWWLAGNKENINESGGDYMAIGVYGQFIYVDPVNKIVIARNSANPHYNEQVEDGSNIGEIEAVEVFRTIAKYYSQ
jgi:CubicO group peptidase (beta-lactamase class C family)